MMFITLTVGASRITVNVSEIESIKQQGDRGSLIRMRGGRSHEVTETHDEVLARLGVLAEMANQ
jgi:hypothetical protein